jgi:hypothetical protein
MFVDILLIKLNTLSKISIFSLLIFIDSFSSSIDIPEFPIDTQVVLELLVASDFLDC